MILVVTSSEDIASMNIRERLLTLAKWDCGGSFQGAEALVHDSLHMILIDVPHLEADGLDAKFRDDHGAPPKLVVFASRHRSQSGKATLTVHPIGNYGDADYGGKPNALVPSAPREMTFALARLRKHGAGLPYEIGYEATHHGPSLSTPTFYIEIGSDETRWPDPIAAEAIAKTILDLEGFETGDAKAPIAVGIGGGHYAPRHTDAALAGLACFGHIVPNHALEEEPERRLGMALDATPGAQAVYFHRKAMKKPLVRELEDWCGEKGVVVLRSEKGAQSQP
ncbi:MAG: D-aminoacyl-tRNA deacylase [Methanobacteriota archaeon]